jgi:plasmid stability protein
MGTTITIRTDEKLRQALVKRAELDGKSVSDLVRSILEAALADRSVQDRAGHLSGRLRLPDRTAPAWRKRIRDNNWRS